MKLNLKQFAGEDVEFTKKLSDVEVKEGNTVDLSIEVPTEDANIVWHKDGQGPNSIEKFWNEFKFQK